MNSMYACLHVPDFAVQAAVRLRPELRIHPTAVIEGDPPLETIFALNAPARAQGVAAGMSRLQAESFRGLKLHRRSLAEEASAQAALLECAGAFSPRIEVVSFQYAQEPGGTVVIDIRGTTSLFGAPGQLAEAACRKVAGCGLKVHVAISENFHAAVCAARGYPGMTELAPGDEARLLAPLPLDVLDLSPEMSATFQLWGIQNCGALAGCRSGSLSHASARKESVCVPWLAVSIRICWFRLKRIFVPNWWRPSNWSIRWKNWNRCCFFFRG